MSYYETVQIFAMAIQSDCSVSDPESLRTTIVEMEKFSGIQRDFRFDKHGDAIIPLMKHVIRDSTFRRVS